MRIGTSTICRFPSSRACIKKISPAVGFQPGELGILAFPVREEREKSLTYFYASRRNMYTVSPETSVFLNNRPASDYGAGAWIALLQGVFIVKLEVGPGSRH